MVMLYLILSDGSYGATISLKKEYLYHVMFLPKKGNQRIINDQQYSHEKAVDVIKLKLEKIIATSRSSFILLIHDRCPKILC